MENKNIFKVLTALGVISSTCIAVHFVLNKKRDAKRHTPKSQNKDQISEGGLKYKYPGRFSRLFD